MLRTVAVSLLSLIVVSSALADTPRILDVEPALIPRDGGSVIVTYSGFSRICSGFDELCAPQAALDGANVPRIAFDNPNGRMTIAVPAHAAGSATLTLTGTQGEQSSTTIHYATGDDYERVLLPLGLQKTPGANGSLWSVTAMARNAGDQISEFLAPFVTGGITTPTPPQHVGPGGTPVLNLSYSQIGDGVFFTVSKFAVNDFAFEERVADTSRIAQTAGTEIPVVRERDYRTKVVLLDVPNDTRYRGMLRIYGFSDDIEHVRVRIFTLNGSDPLVDEVHDTSGVIHHAAPPSAFPPPHPAYLQLPLTTWPALALAGSNSLRIEVTAENGAKLWGFVSITNNDTQQVTVVSPQ
jgi:hypothetical protein